MKKRKPPIILASVLIVMVGAAAFMNQKPADPSTQPPPTPPPAAEKRETESKSDVAKRVGDLVNNSPAPAGKEPNHLAPMPHPGSDMPAAMQKKAAEAKARMEKTGIDPMKPKPNDSSTSTQWYTEETGKG